MVRLIDGSGKSEQADVCVAEVERRIAEIRRAAEVDEAEPAGEQDPAIPAQEDD